MLTKEQASVVADQLTQDAKSRNDSRALIRLESRGGAIPRGISLERFAALVAKEQSRVILRCPFVMFLAALTFVLGVEAYFHASALVVATIPMGFLLARLIARKLVAAGIRDTIKCDA